MKVNGKDDIPYIMENKTCSKPPTIISHPTYRCAMGKIGRGEPGCEPEHPSGTPHDAARVRNVEGGMYL